MSNIKVIAEHSVDISLLSRDSKVLDLGCRNFGWAKEMLEYVDRVICVDADRDIVSPDERLVLYHSAVGVNQSDSVPYVKFGNGTGNFVLQNEFLPEDSIIDRVPMTTLYELSNKYEVEQWDLIKFDIEGSEADILMNLRRPIAKQISFELHQHTAKKKSEEFIGQMFTRLQQWYDIVFVDYSAKHGAGLNYWDCLIKLKQ